jgi:hypothetical protein
LYSQISNTLRTLRTLRTVCVTPILRHCVRSGHLTSQHYILRNTLRSIQVRCCATLCTLCRYMIYGVQAVCTACATTCDLWLLHVVHRTIYTYNFLQQKKPQTLLPVTRPACHRPSQRKGRGSGGSLALLLEGEKAAGSLLYLGRLEGGASMGNGGGRSHGTSTTTTTTTIVGCYWLACTCTPRGRARPMQEGVLSALACAEEADRVFPLPGQH